MQEPQIQVNRLTKTYDVPERAPGLAAALKGLIRRQIRQVPAVQDLSFQIRSGEMVGLIGANGAGKTTTLKMLCGVLHPTAGEASLFGFVPWERKPAYLSRVSMVMGNRSQMIWDIPPLDTFRVLAEIYNVPRHEFHRTLDELVALLDLEPLLHRPARNLSLGERMKCELVAGLIHQPRVLFLDEPTLGLDVSMQQRLRTFLRAVNQRTGVTIILTSHYMADVVALCPRVLLIHEGRLLHDGALSDLARQLAPFKQIRLTLTQAAEVPLDAALLNGCEVISHEGNQISLRVAREDAAAATARLLSALSLADLTVEDPPIEAVIDRIYQQGGVPRPSDGLNGDAGVTGASSSPTSSTESGGGVV